MKWKFLAAFLSVTLAGSVSGKGKSTYPNELPGYHFRKTAKWRSLVVCGSTIADVRKLLGNPDDATDLAHPVEAYSGDGSATSVVFTYSRLMPGWDVLIYLKKSCGGSEAPRLCNVDLIPHRRIPFMEVSFPSAFTKRHVVAADAAWDEYSDGSGLRYEVYTTQTPYGHEVAGDLNRISYGVP